MIKQSSDAFEMSEQKKNQPKTKATKREVLGEVLHEVLYFSTR